MGFNSYHNQVQSPAKQFHRWKGGEGKLIHWDAEATNDKGEQGAEVEAKLPFKFAILEQTRRIAGFSPSGNGTRFYSNEAVEYNDSLRVMKKEGDNPAEEVINGAYNQIKGSLPQGARLAVQLYIYNFGTNQIELVTLQGSSLRPFIEFSKKNRIYENWVQMEKGEEAKTGSVTYFPPAYNISEKFTKEDMEKLDAADKEIIEYLKYVHDRNANNSSDADQTPSQYEGEQSQEIVEDDDVVPAEAEGVDFGAVPF